MRPLQPLSLPPMGPSMVPPDPRSAAFMDQYWRQHQLGPYYTPGGVGTDYTGVGQAQDSGGFQAESQRPDAQMQALQMLLQAAAQRQRADMGPQENVGVDYSGMNPVAQGLQQAEVPPSTPGMVTDAPGSLAPATPGDQEKKAKPGTDWASLLASSAGVGLLGAGGNMGMQTAALKAMVDNQMLRQSAMGMSEVDKVMLSLVNAVAAQRKKARRPLAGLGATQEPDE